jgi:polyhydroxyalkanoate synthase subunit PhaC
VSIDNKGDNNQVLQFEEFYKNITNAALIYQNAFQQLFTKNNGNSEKPDIDPLSLGKTFLHAAEEVLSDPESLMESNIKLAKNYVELCNNITKKILGYEVEEIYKTDNKDNRFKDSEWRDNPIFAFIKQSYLLNSSWISGIVKTLKSLDSKESKKLDFYSRMLIDAMSPTNFFLTNPEVLRETLRTNAKNLIKGSENLLRDVVNNMDGPFRISTSNNEAFKVGKNLAVTPGKVVFQNDLIQLIQYESTTGEVYETPIIVMPAWINKFYILDLQTKNSFVKWAVDRGMTVFMISWVNPNENHTSKTFDDYMLEGAITALEKVQQITGKKQVNFVGYCLGGTLLACVISYLKSKYKNKEFPIKSATFLTSLVDFEEAGDLSIFVDDEQLEKLESRMSHKGHLEGSDMALTFSMIRANDMIWSFFINNYLMGKDILPFDILYWNSDSTRLPAKMHIFYLRNMYQNNLLVKPNGIKLGGVGIDIRKNDIPTYMLATVQDHIVPWVSAYKATQFYTGPIRFVLSGSGHVAGVVNHPANNRYNYWTNDKLESDPDKWLKDAKNNDGSWWNDWSKWIDEMSGKKIKSSTINPKNAIENAPGSFVKVRI